MTAERAFHVHPVGDVKKTPGVTHLFVVFCPEDRKKKEIDELLRAKLERMIFVDTSAREVSMFAVTFPNIREAEETFKWIASQRGGERTKMYMMKEIFPVHSWFDGEIERRLALMKSRSS